MMGSNGLRWYMRPNTLALGIVLLPCQKTIGKRLAAVGCYARRITVHSLNFFMIRGIL
jgi:hypothetical protein